MPSLNFKGKALVQNFHLLVPFHELKPVKAKSLTGKPSLHDNLVVHGDNLKALKALLPYYHGAVKCIYIDPPYNTGNEAWVYNDNVNSPMMQEWLGKVVDREDLTRHDKWLCMMMPRLKLMREFLTEDGVIFISIDDNEAHWLRGLMDEVFGEENFVASIVWHKVDSPKNTAMHLSEDHEYILLYARHKELWRPNLLPRTETMIERYKNPDNDPRGPWLLSDLAARNFYAQGRYSIKTKTGRVIAGPPAGSYWRVNRERFDELERDNRIWWGESGDNRPGIKRFLSEVREGVVPQTL
jgi:adenine specific DNA methylase Mod